MICEIGLYINGKLLLNSINNQYKIKFLEKSLICALISAVEIFFRTIFFQEIDYIKGKHHLLIFSKEIIKNMVSAESQHIVAYAIVYNDKDNIDEFVKKDIQPKLKFLLSLFNDRYSHSNFTETHRFQKFKKEIDKIFAEV